MTNSESSYIRKITWLSVFAVAMGYFEAAVVVYLREIVYPGGFSFPLREMRTKLVVIEVFREASTIIMLATVAILSGRKPWERFGIFIYSFGIWDVFYYIWLKATIGWPSSLLDWDILFLIPAPWVGPVLAPVLVSLLMVMGGSIILGLSDRGYDFKPTRAGWALAICGTLAILFSFMNDSEAMFGRQTPRPYLYPLLYVGLALCTAALLLSCRNTMANREE